MVWSILSLALLLLLNQHICDGLSYKRSMRKHSSLCLAKKLSYEEMLQQAKLNKESGNNNRRIKSTVPISTTKAPVEKKQVPSGKRSNDGLPFSDEMYSHLKYVIEKISGRMKNEAPLTRDEIKKLKESVDAIIADSIEELDNATNEEDDIYSDNIRNNVFENRLLVPLDDDDTEDDNGNNAMYNDDPEEIGSITMRAREEENNRIRKTQPETNSAKDPFGMVRGKYKSLWGFDESEIENVSTEEYYSKVNKRIADMKQRRRELGEYDPEIAKNYEEQLNNMNRKQNN